MEGVKNPSKGGVNMKLKLDKYVRKIDERKNKIYNKKIMKFFRNKTKPENFEKLKIILESEYKNINFQIRISEEGAFLVADFEDCYIEEYIQECVYIRKEISILTILYTPLFYDEGVIYRNLTFEEFIEIYYLDLLKLPRPKLFDIFDNIFKFLEEIKENIKNIHFFNKYPQNRVIYIKGQFKRILIETPTEIGIEIKLLDDLNEKFLNEIFSKVEIIEE
jgi:hypothetical protein